MFTPKDCAIAVARIISEELRLEAEYKQKLKALHEKKDKLLREWEQLRRVSDYIDDIIEPRLDTPSNQTRRMKAARVRQERAAAAFKIKQFEAEVRQLKLVKGGKNED